MKTRAALLFDAFGNGLRLLGSLWLPVTLGVVAVVILSWPSQIIEFYRATSENIIWAASTSSPTFPLEAAKIIAAYFALLAMGSVLVLTCRMIQLDSGMVAKRASALWLPIAIGAAPLFATAAGLYFASLLNPDLVAEDVVKKIHDMGDDDFASNVKTAFDYSGKSFAALKLASLLMAVTGTAFVFVSWLLRGPGNFRLAVFQRCSTTTAVLFSAGVIGLLTAIIAYAVIPFSTYFNVASTFAIFVMCASWSSAQLTILSKRHSMPYIPVLLGLAVLWSLLNFNDNHELIHLAAANKEATAPVPLLPDVEEQFLAWYEHRKDAYENGNDAGHTNTNADATFRNKKYPVYIVSAQGGGIAAAAQVLLFLVTTQGNCERFAEHLFAISGVSGGSVGAAFYAGLAKNFERGVLPCPTVNETPHRPSAKLIAARSQAFDLLLQDYLTPLTAAMLFPDFIQRFIPWPVPTWSRAHALEKALENAWDVSAETRKIATTSNPLKEGIVSAWSPNSAVPALFFNTTETWSGRRRLIAPFKFTTAEEGDLRFMPISKDFDLSISTAAVASARFPWITPAAWFKNPQKDGSPGYFRLVDGGYFENSGVATAIDLIDRLEEIAQLRRLPVEFYLLATTSGGYLDSSYDGLDELISPIMSLLNTRRARQYTVIELAKRRLGMTTVAELSSAEGREKTFRRIPRLQKVEITDTLTKLPLGWNLSSSTNFEIFLQSGRFWHCEPDAQYVQTVKQPFFETSDCVKSLILHQLRGEYLEEITPSPGSQVPH